MSPFEVIWTPGASLVASALELRGHETRQVGGAVRDAILGRKSKDIDLATTASADEMVAAAHDAGLRTVPSARSFAAHGEFYNKNGTVLFVVDGEPLEVTTLRGDAPSSFEADAARRDFTFNSMSVDRSGVLHDPFGGAQDLKAGAVRFTGDAAARIAEDAARSLRFFRFRAAFGARSSEARALDLSTLATIRDNASLVSSIAGERVWREMAALLASERGLGELRCMAEVGVADAVGYPVAAAFAAGGAADPMRRLPTAARHGAEPAVCLGFSLSGEEGHVGPSPSDMRRLWKFGNDALAMANAAVDLYWMADAPFRDLLDLALTPRGYGAHRVASVMVGFGREAEAAELRDNLPRFPLEGADLIADGMTPGPAVGLELSALRRAWTMSGYVATKDELLAPRTSLRRR